MEGRWLAAVLAVGRGPHGGGHVLDHWQAAVSHRSAASLWEMLSASEGQVDVIVAGYGGRVRRVGIRVHRSQTLTRRDVILRYGIPVTTPARTVADLGDATARGSAGAVSRGELRRAIRQANVIGLPLDREDAVDRTRSDLEADFLRICKRYRLPRPEVNVWIGAFLVDFLWRAERLVVETDGYLYHRGRAAFQDDRSRELELMRLGYHVLRLSEAQINGAPKDVANVLGEELRKRRGS
jgi:very-short-patch-repair endonuclease